jgi:hypothetical protein
MNSDGSGVTLLATDAISPAWSPAGDAIVAIPTSSNPGNPPKATDLLALEVLNSSGATLSAHKASISGKAVGDPAWGPDGRIAYRSAGTCSTTQVLAAHGDQRRWHRQELRVDHLHQRHGAGLASVSPEDVKRARRLPGPSCSRKLSAGCR